MTSSTTTAPSGNLARTTSGAALQARSVLLLAALAFTTCTVFMRQVWPLLVFEFAILVLVAGCLLSDIKGSAERRASGWIPWLVYLVPCWGLLQIVTHSTASTFETRTEVLKWCALAGVFFIAQTSAGTDAARHAILNAFLIFASAIALLCVTQLYTSNGRVLWLFDSGYPDVFGTFQYHNNYAQFVELPLPIALWQLMRNGLRSWGYGLCAGLLYASVIACASRAGAVLCTAELFVTLAIGLVRQRSSRANRSLSMVSLLAVPVLALVFTAIVGWHAVLSRFQTRDPFSGRREFVAAAIDMVKHKPLTGYGLGTFPEVYQQHAVRDFPFYANHTHCDWAEFAADGGIPFLLLVLIPFAASVPIAVRHPWGIGLVAVLLHACIDYPFPRPAVSGWMFLMLALLFRARDLHPDKRKGKLFAVPS